MCPDYRQCLKHLKDAAERKFSTIGKPMGDWMLNIALSDDGEANLQYAIELCETLLKNS